MVFRPISLFLVQNVDMAEYFMDFLSHTKISEFLGIFKEKKKWSFLSKFFLKTLFILFDFRTSERKAYFIVIYH